MNKSIITKKDVLILEKLLEDGRKSSASISKEIDLGREIVNYRIKRLIKENLIIKFIPKLNESAMNYQEYIILLKLKLDDEVSKQKFIHDTIGNKYLIWTIKSDSGWDLIVRLYAENNNEFKTKLSEILERFSDVLSNYYTIISSNKIKENEKEILAEKLFKNETTNKDFSLIKNKTLNHIDSKDRNIIEFLNENGRIQYKEIASELDISSDTVKYRIEKMKSLGIIEKFTPVLNYNKLGFYQYSIIIKFSFLNKEENLNLNEILLNNKNVIKAIKSVSLDEYFLNLIFENENEIDNFSKYIKNKFENKIDNLEIFKLD